MIQKSQAISIKFFPFVSEVKIIENLVTYRIEQIKVVRTQTIRGISVIFAQLLIINQRNKHLIQKRFPIFFQTEDFQNFNQKMILVHNYQISHHQTMLFHKLFLRSSENIVKTITLQRK